MLASVRSVFCACFLLDARPLSVPIFAIAIVSVANPPLPCTRASALLHGLPRSHPFPSCPAQTRRAPTHRSQAFAATRSRPSSRSVCPEPHLARVLCVSPLCHAFPRLPAPSANLCQPLPSSATLHHITTPLRLALCRCLPARMTCRPITRHTQAAKTAPSPSGA